MEAASERLGEYSKEFLRMEASADDTKRELRSLVNELRSPAPDADPGAKRHLEKALAAARLSLGFSATHVLAFL